MKTLAILFLTIAITTASFANNGTDTKAKKSWAFDKSHSAVTFNIRHILTPVEGKFSDYDGQVHFNPENLAESSINVTIKVASIDTDNAKRDGHLQSPDFFEAEKYPSITFVSSEIIDKGNKNYVAKGKLTIKNVTKEIELPFTLLGTMAHPFIKGSEIAAFQASFALNRNAFNVGSGDWVQTAIVGEEVNIDITLEMFTAK